MGMGSAFSPKEITKEMTVEEALSPSSTVRFKAEELPLLSFVTEDFGSGLSCGERMRTYRELEGQFLDYITQESGKPVLLSGPCLPETKIQRFDEKWVCWLSQFELGSVVFCAFGSKSELQRDEFQELVLGFESCGLPFLVALKPPKGCSTVEAALPEGFVERVEGRGLVHGYWVPQQLLLHHPNIGCFVNHYQILNKRWTVNELKIGGEVERGKNRRVSKESLNEAIKLVMDKDNESAKMLRANHVKLTQTLCSSYLHEEYINNFIQALHHLV
ncbi:UDP-glycosyltransferase 79B6-like [Hibiscus syriacus]|uniref:UDP-glycosyltransferase 79B6-like n=1 Tax=Hibiscus syriacus TaxID=106335 RepID=UPI00192420A4|nr:UDP-glycosyltransferase 79B6-like [Hibiscus syriacus]